MTFRSPYAVLILGIASVSFAAIFIRLAEAPAAVIAFYRMGFATAALLPIVWWQERHLFRSIPRSHLGWMALGGLFLALHFMLWISSFSLTSVASSVFFVTTQPIFVATASIFLFKEKASVYLFIGIALAGVGSLIIGAGDLQALGSGNLTGNLLALAGSVMAASYFLVGRHVRQTVSLGLYIVGVYGVSAFVLLLFILFAGHPLVGYSGQTWWSMVLLAVIPTLIGHTCFNWALKYVPAPIVSTAILGEPVGATVLAYFILQEAPRWYTILGGALILLGIYASSQGRTKTGVRVNEDLSQTS